MTEYINRKARSFYNILETIEAGIVLSGAEVKAVRTGRVDFKGSYVTFTNLRPYVINLNIGKYAFAQDDSYEPKKPRKLLMKKREIKRYYGLSQRKGITLIPIKIYVKNNFVKVEVGICEGKNKKDVREYLKNKAIERDIEIELRGKRK